MGLGVRVGAFGYRVRVMAWVMVRVGGMVRVGVGLG